MIFKQVKTSLLTIHDLDLSMAAKAVQCLSRRGSFAYVVTPNIDHMARLCELREEAAADQALLGIYQNADLCLCDSRILKRILSFAGHSIHSVVAGSDLTKYLFDQVLLPDDRVLVLGSEEQRIGRLRERYPDLSIEHINPSMGFIDKPQEVDQLVKCLLDKQYDYIFLAVGSPRQEVFAHKLKLAGIGRGVALCVGASINFLIGAEKRAPKIMQVLHLEWLYRMLQDPARLAKRYFMNALSLKKIYGRLKL